MGDLTANISRDELKCPCCGKMEFSMDFVNLLQRLRDEANIIRKEIEFEQECKIREVGLHFVHGGGYRCPHHDVEIGGKGEHSSAAVDVGYRDSLECWILIKAADRVGIKRIGLNNGAIHFGADSSYPNPRFWNYYKTERMA